MKNLYAFLGLLLVSLLGISGCKTLFDVEPKGVYSPIELDASLVPLRIRSGPYLHYPLSETSCQVQFRANDPSLKYGALIFYDSIAAASFVLERKIIGQVQSVMAGPASTGTNVFISDTVGFDNTKGQYVYVTPYAYKNEDSTAIRKSDYRKTFSSKGYIQLKISPWFHFADISPPLTSTVYQSVHLIQGTDKLSYLKYIQSSALNSNPLYEYDSVAHRWGDKIGAIPINMVIKINNSYEIKKDISFIHKVFYRTGKYHIVCSVFSRENNPALVEARSSISIINLTKEFIVTPNKVFNNEDVTQFAFGLNLPSANVIHSIFNLDEVGVFSNINYDETKLSITTLPNSTTNRVASEATLPDQFTKAEFKRPTIALNIDGKYIFNNTIDQTNFSVLKISGKNVSVLQNKRISNNLFGSFNGFSKFICLSDGPQGYIVAQNQVIHKITLDNSNTPIVGNFYQGWFPGNGPTSIIETIMYKGQLAFLLNNYEVWLFNPSQIKVEFDPAKRPGAFTIVSL